MQELILYLKKQDNGFKTSGERKKGEEDQLITNTTNQASSGAQPCSGPLGFHYDRPKRDLNQQHTATHLPPLLFEPPEILLKIIGPGVGGEVFSPILIPPQIREFRTSC